MDSFFERAFKAVLIFFIGLHLIAFGMIHSHANVPSNPLWRAFSLLFKVELIALLMASFIFLAIFIRWILNYDSERENISVDDLKHFERDSQPLSHSSGGGFKEAEKLITEAPPPKPSPPEPPKLSAEEKKTRALKQIVRGY